MSLLLILLVCLSVALLSWVSLLGFQHALAHYRQYFTEQARINLVEVFMFLDPKHVWQLTLLISISVTVLSYAFFSQIMLSMVFGALMWLIPKPLLNRLKKRRLHMFDQQLPEALLFLSGSLRAGLSVQTALVQLLSDASPPLSQEFGLVLKEQRLGQTLDVCLTHLQERMPTESSFLLVASLRVAQDTGGSLAQTIDDIADTIRSRLHLEGRISALTSQGRMQAWIIGLLPMVLFAILYQLDAERMRLFWTTSIGWMMLFLWGMLEVIGMFWITKIVNIRV